MRVAENLPLQQTEMPADLRLREQPRSGVIQVDLVAIVEDRVFVVAKQIERGGGLVVRLLFEIEEGRHHRSGPGRTLRTCFEYIRLRYDPPRIRTRPHLRRFSFHTAARRGAE